VAVLMFAGGTVLFSDAASAAPDATIEFTLYEAGFIVDGSGGTGPSSSWPSDRWASRASRGSLTQRSCSLCTTAPA
jgi:hypothetical protein